MSNLTPVTGETFDAEVLEADVPVLVDVFATWCGPCKAIAPILDQLATQFGDKVKFVAVDVDVSPDLSEKYGIRGVPTLLLVKNGEVVDTVVGAVPKDDIERRLHEMLAD